MHISTYMISTQFYKKTIVCADILVKTLHFEIIDFITT